MDTKESKCFIHQFQNFGIREVSSSSSSSSFCPQKHNLPWDIGYLPKEAQFNHEITEVEFEHSKQMNLNFKLLSNLKVCKQIGHHVCDESSSIKYPLTPSFGTLHVEDYTDLIHFEVPLCITTLYTTIKKPRDHPCVLQKIQGGMYLPSIIRWIHTAYHSAAVPPKTILPNLYILELHDTPKGTCLMFLDKIFEDNPQVSHLTWYSSAKPSIFRALFYRKNLSTNLQNFKFILHETMNKEIDIWIILHYFQKMFPNLTDLTLDCPQWQKELTSTEATRFFEENFPNVFIVVESPIIDHGRSQSNVCVYTDGRTLSSTNRVKCEETKTSR